MSMNPLKEISLRGVKSQESANNFSNYTVIDLPLAFSKSFDGFFKALGDSFR
jgi:hypothetical protein